MLEPHGLEQTCTQHSLLEARVDVSTSTKRTHAPGLVTATDRSKQETTQNKRVLRELVSRWNRPVYEKETNYRARRPAHDDLEAMEVRPKGGGGAGRRVVSGSMSQRELASKDEAVGNILSAKAKGIDPTKSRVPFSNGYAFSKAPKSRVEGQGRAPTQQVWPFPLVCVCVPACGVHCPGRFSNAKANLRCQSQWWDINASN